MQLLGAARWRWRRWRRKGRRTKRDRRAASEPAAVRERASSRRARRRRAGRRRDSVSRFRRASSPPNESSRLGAPMNSTEACIALNMLPKMGPVRLRKLLEVFETPERILTAKRERACERSKASAMKSPSKSRIGKTRSISPRNSSASANSARSDHRRIADLSAPAARNSCAADRALRLGRTDGARSARHRRHRFAAHQPLRRGVREEAFLSARLRRSHRHQRAGARHRHRRAPRRARRQRSHDCRDRFRVNETLSAGKRRARGKDPRRQRRGRFRVFDGGRAGPPNAFRCATASSAAGATAFSWSKPG